MQYGIHSFINSFIYLQYPGLDHGGSWAYVRNTRRRAEEFLLYWMLVYCSAIYIYLFTPPHPSCSVACGNNVSNTSWGTPLHLLMHVVIQSANQSITRQHCQVKSFSWCLHQTSEWGLKCDLGDFDRAWYRCKTRWIDYFIFRDFHCRVYTERCEK